jgi:O-antigen/teichoic acid export membrane protein
MSVGRSSLGVFLSQGIGLVLSFGNSVFLTRALGVTGRGEFAIFTAAVGLLSILLGLGLEVSLRYYIAKGQVPRDRLLTSTLLYIVLVSSALWMAVHLNHLLLSNDLFLPASKQTTIFELALVGVVAANLFHSNISSVFWGDRNFKVINLASVGFAILSLLFYAGLYGAQVLGGLPIGSGEVFLTYSALAVFNSVVMGGMAVRLAHVRFSVTLFDRGLVLRMLTYAGKSYLAGLAQFLNYRVDYWLVEYYTGSSTLGLYSLASSLAMMLWILPRSVSSVLLPSAAAGEPEAGPLETARQARVVFTIVLLLSLPLAMSARAWISLFYGADFVAATSAFVILLVGCVPFTVCIVLAATLAGMNRVGINLGASASGLAVTVVLDVLLIPRFGMGGAAAASAVSYLVTTVVVLISFSRLTSVPAGSCVFPKTEDARYLRDGFKSILR